MFHSQSEPKRRVLVVDDSALLNYAMAEGAAAAHCEVEQAFSGRKAIAMIAVDNRFDVVITDTRMDDGDGISVLQYLYDTFDPGVRPVTYLLSSIDSYSIAGDEVRLSAYVPEAFPGTTFVLKGTDLEQQVNELLTGL